MSIEPIKVLLIENNNEDIVKVDEILNKSDNAKFELTHTPRLDSGLMHLANEKFDIIILNLDLPDSVGLNSFIALLKQNPNIPIILLTEIANEEIGIECIKNGAQDYLVKGEFNGKLLVRAIQYAIERKKIEGLFNY